MNMIVEFNEYSNFYTTFGSNITKFTIYVHKYEIYSNGKKYSKSEFFKYYHFWYLDTSNIMIIELH